MKFVTAMVAGIAAIGGYAAFRMVTNKSAKPTNEIPIRIDDVLEINLSDPQIIRPPGGALIPLTNQFMRTISLTSPQGPNFIIVKKESTFNDPREFILSVPRSSILQNMTNGGFAIGF